MAASNARPEGDTQRPVRQRAQPCASEADEAAAAQIASPEHLRTLSGELDLALSNEQCRQLLAYGALIRRWNRVYNLTAADGAQELLTRHLLDSLAIVRPLEQALQRYGAHLPAGQPLRFLDAGSGAGLPGIPLAIARPDWHGHLVDAVQKKCAFLQQACVELQLRNLSVQHARLESCPMPPQSLIVSRAFASLRDFVTLTRPHLAEHGLWAAMKGRDPSQEIGELPAGLEVLETITLRVPLLHEQRHLVLLRARPAAGGQSPGATGGPRPA